MKKVALLTAMATMVFVLAACGSAPATADGGSTNGFRAGANATGPLNAQEKLALGTIKLEGTKQAVDPKMAANLVPLWQLLFQLNSSSSSAPQEVAAVTDQIKATMTPAQLSTISSMTLTQADIFTVFQQEAQANGAGGSASNGAGPSNFTGGNRENRGTGGGGGGFVFAGGGPGGGPGGGGFGGGGAINGAVAGSTPTTTQGSAETAAQAAQARQNATSNLVINQVIRLLETKLKT